MCNNVVYYNSSDCSSIMMYTRHVSLTVPRQYFCLPPNLCLYYVCVSNFYFKYSNYYCAFVMVQFRQLCVLYVVSPTRLKSILSVNSYDFLRTLTALIELFTLQLQNLEIIKSFSQKIKGLLQASKPLFLSFKK